MSRCQSSLLVAFGVLTFSYVTLVGIAIARFSYFNGPLPDLLYGIPVPTMLGLAAGVITFRIKGSGAN